uniref:RNase H type-1 domain-containing protein n=1 Tax=Cannabis sativa TaxID=3483 RepID=A0A803NLW4_CANSA
MCQLLTKRVAVSALCPVCELEEETILHCLFTCHHVHLCWDRVGIGTQIPVNHNFLSWMALLFEKLEVEMKAMVATLCWAIWNARNELVWKRKRVAEISWPGFYAGDGAEQWSYPPENSVKINVDAALFDDGNRAGVGVLLRDAKGLFIEGFTRMFQEALDPALVEAMGVREALSWLKRRPRQQAFVETDCLTVVQALRSQVKMISLFGIVISECKCILQELKNVSICFIKRSAYMVAHCVVRASILHPDRSFNLRDVPTDLLPYLVAEFVG